VRVLGIETSCDETAVALVETNPWSTDILSQLVSSQIDLHRPYGGVVPEVATRGHLRNLPLLHKTSGGARRPGGDAEGWPLPATNRPVLSGRLFRLRENQSARRWGQRRLPPRYFVPTKAVRNIERNGKSASP
jgi:hypothetical protein